MDLNLLTIFESVARGTSFSSAAKELGLPKSTVSRGIARLEAELGTQLLLRTTRQVSLTAEGTALYVQVFDPVSGPLTGVAYDIDVAHVLPGDGIYQRRINILPAARRPADLVQIEGDQIGFLPDFE